MDLFKKIEFAIIDIEMSIARAGAWNTYIMLLKKRSCENPIIVKVETIALLRAIIRFDDSRFGNLCSLLYELHRKGKQKNRLERCPLKSKHLI